MDKFLYQVFVYLVSFIICLYGLSALDFNRLLKKNKISQAWILYFVVACSLAYLFGNFLMALIYSFNK